MPQRFSSWNGATITRGTVSGTQFFRLLRIDDGAFPNNNSATLSGLTLNRGYANAVVAGGGSAGQQGGAVDIQSHSVVNINDCIFTNNHAEVSGGAIKSTREPLTLNRCTISKQDWKARSIGTYRILIGGSLY